MVQKQTANDSNSTRRTYLSAAGAALGVATLATGTAAADDSDDCDPKKKDGEFGGRDPLRVIDEPGEYELDEDLEVDDGETGILIIASNVSLNGNGNTISGDDDGIGIFVTSDFGTVTDVLIENVVFEDLRIGIELFEPVRTRIRNCVFTDCQEGFIQTNDTEDTILEDNTFENSPVQLGTSGEAVVIGNTITDSDGTGLELTDTSTATVVDNEISGHSGPGVALNSAFTNRFFRNEIRDNGEAGVQLESSSRNRFTLNRITDNDGPGIEVDAGSEDNKFTTNDLRDNDGGSCDVDDDATGNQFAGNEPECDEA